MIQFEATLGVPAFKAAESEDIREETQECPNSRFHPAVGSFGQDRAWPGVMYNACNDADTEFMELKEGQKSSPYETPSMFTFAWEWKSFFCSAG